MTEAEVSGASLKAELRLQKPSKRDSTIRAYLGRPRVRFRVQVATRYMMQQGLASKTGLEGRGLKLRDVRVDR